MNAKENARRIILFDQPERVMTDIPQYLLHYLGANHEAFGGIDDKLIPVGTTWTDVWGTVWHKEQEGVMGMIRQTPLATPDMLKSYQWPDPDDERLIGQVFTQAKEFPHDDRFLSGSHRDTLWEKAYMLVGMEDLMVYFYTEPEFVREVLHRIMDFHLGIAKHYLDLGVELVYLTDDLGCQRGLILSPKIIEEFFVPEYERLFRFYRERKVLTNFHSCGKIDEALEIFMKLGVSVLNPVQATANNLELVRAKTQGRMALLGGVSSATIMDGPAERVAAEARERLWQLGREGGYFCAPDQNMPFPPEHLDALERTVEEHGKYPLKL